MKKITLFVAAVLVSAGMSAQTVQKWMAYNEEDSVELFFPWNTADIGWCGEDEDAIDGVALPFASGSTALFNDEVIEALSEEFLEDQATTSPTITVSAIDAIGGIRVENSTVTYHFVPANETVTFEGPEGAAIIKSNDGIMYTDVTNNLPGGTIVKGGTVARNSSASAENHIFGKTVTVEGEGSIDVGKNTKDPYYKLVADLLIPEGMTMNVYMPTYSMFCKDSAQKVSGAGTLNFYTQGSRAFLGGGSKGESAPVDFSGFTGDINVYARPGVADGSINNIIFATNSAKGKGATSQYFDRQSGDSLLYNVWQRDQVLLDSLVYDLGDVDLTVNEDATIAVGSASNDAGSNVTLLRVKSFNVKEKGMVIGYYKASNPQLVVIFGADDADGYLDGVFTSGVKGADTTGYGPYKESGVGLYKEGKGTYYLTSNENQLFLGVDVWEGRMMFNNSLDTATATGQHKTSTNNTVTCRATGTIGGYGTIGGHTALYGTLQPGSDAIGTLRIDGTYAKVAYVTGKKNEVTHTHQRGNEIFGRTAGSAANLLLYNGANMEFEIINKDNHDQVLVQNEVRVYDEGEAPKINVKLSPRDKWSVAVGDSIVLMTSDTIRGYLNGVTNEAFDAASCYNLVVDEAFGDAKFELATVKIPAVVKSYYDPVEDKNVVEEVSPSQFKLVAVVTAAGSGEAEPDAIESVEADNSNLQVYPNPAVGGNVTVAVAAGEVAEVAVYNSAAQLVKSVATSESTLTLDVSDLQAGIYYVRVKTADNAYTQKLIVE